MRGVVERFELRPETFTKWHQQLCPQPDEERWLEIPWRTNLWQARSEALATNRPIFVWAMDGHPLGCT